MRTIRRSLSASILTAASVGLCVLNGEAAFAQGAGVEVDEPEIPAGVDVFSLNLGQTKAFSRRENFKVVGHSYFKGPHLTQAAQDEGTGAGINTVRVFDGVAYLAGYNGPPTMFGILLASVTNVRNMHILSFIPCRPGTRCPYLRVDREENILIFANSTHPANPEQPAGPEDNGWSFWDVSDPTNPTLLSHFPVAPLGTTHGMDIDDQSFLYGCGETTSETNRDELQIIDYSIPEAPALVSTLHITGQHEGEEFAPEDQLNPDGTDQIISCHEIVYHNDRVYVAYRDAGLVIIDVTDRSDPQIIGRLDYVPPFNGGSLGAAHTSAPVVVDPAEHPSLVVHTDEIFTCPPGFGRIIDVSDLQSPEVVDGDRPANLQVISSFRLPHVSDVYDFDAEEFLCLPGQQSIHLPWFDMRSPSLFYQAWYDQGVRAWDISNPFLPREVGFYLSPRYASFGNVDRHTREVFQDPDTGLLYVTDGNGGGLTVLEWTGPIPEHPPLPGAR